MPAGYVVALPRTAGELFPSHAAFALDLAFVLDRLQAEGADPASTFFGHVAATSAVMGHSMGGGASFLAAAANPGITALAALAPADTNPSAIAAAPGVSQPSLVFAGSADCVTPPAQHQEPMYAALGSSCRTYVVIEGGSHCGFENDSFLCTLGELFCGSPLTLAQQQGLVAQHLVPWLDHQLKSSPGAWPAFQGLLAAGAGISGAQDCAPDPTGAEGLLAAQSGTALVTGANVDAATSVAVGGTPVAFMAPAPGQLELALGADEPGFQDVTLDTGFQDATAAGALARWPALAAGPAILGQPLDVRIENGGPGLYALGVAAGLGSPLALPGIDHELLLTAPTVIAGGGFDPATGEVSLAFPVPSDVGLAGKSFALQAWGSQASSQSFTNAALVTVEL